MGLAEPVASAAEGQRVITLAVVMLLAVISPITEFLSISRSMREFSSGLHPAGPAPDRRPTLPYRDRAALSRTPPHETTDHLNPKPPNDTAPLSPFDRDLQRSASIVDSHWDDLGGLDPIEDYTGRAGRLRDEDGSW